MDRMCIFSNASLLLLPSDEDVCFCYERDGCSGGMIVTSWHHIKKVGAVSGGAVSSVQACARTSHCLIATATGLREMTHTQPRAILDASNRHPLPARKKCDANAIGEHANFAKDKHQFKRQILTVNGEERIKQMIMKGGPVETAFTVFSDFENFAGGIYHHVTGQMAATML